MANAVPTRDIFVEANGIRHHLLARGTPGNPAVMVVHGLTQQAHAFDAFSSALAASFHVYCLDVRGRGESGWGPPDAYIVESYVEDLEAVREALSLARFALVGTSMGGLISMHYAAAHPDRVTRVVLNDVGTELAPDGLSRVLKMLTTAPDAFADLKSVVRYYREENAPVLAHRSDDEVLDYARWHVRKNDLGLYTWKMDPAIRQPQRQRPSQLDAAASFRAMRCPVLIIRGSQSDILPREVAERMVAEQPGTEIIEIAGIGHAPTLAEPRALDAVRRFLGGGPG